MLFRSAVRLAALQLADPATEWSAIVVRRPNTGRNPIAMRIRLVGDDATARRVLSMGAQLLEWATRDAVPLLERTSSSLGGGATTVKPDDWEADCKDDSVSRLFAHGGPDTFLAAAVLPSDPDPVREIAAARNVGRAIATASWVWGTVDQAALVVRSRNEHPPKSFDDHLASEAKKAGKAVKAAAKRSTAAAAAEELA